MHVGDTLDDKRIGHVHVGDTNDDKRIGHVHVGDTKDGKGIEKVHVGDTIDGTNSSECTIGHATNYKSSFHGKSKTVVGKAVPVGLCDSTDVDSEEHCVMRGSSDGSQCGSDSGMGDSLMNTSASEWADGCSNTLAVPLINNVPQKDPRGPASDCVTDVNDYTNIEQMVLSRPDQKEHDKNGEIDDLVTSVGETILIKTVRDLEDFEWTDNIDKPLQVITSVCCDSLSVSSTDKDVIDVSFDDRDDDEETVVDTRVSSMDHGVHLVESDGEETLVNTRVSSMDHGVHLVESDGEITLVDTRVSSMDHGVHLVESDVEITSNDDGQRNACWKDASVDNVNEEVEKLNNDDSFKEEHVPLSILQDPLQSISQSGVETIEQFLHEPDALFQKLVHFEEMLKPDENRPDKLKSSLIKHAAVCIEMKNIETRMNIVNRHAPNFTRKAQSGLHKVLEERLKALNNQWDELRENASTRQKDLERRLHDHTESETSSDEDNCVYALKKNTALLSSLYFNTENEEIKRFLNKLGSFTVASDPQDSRRHFNEDFMNYQSSFHDLFEWLTSTEDSVDGIPVGNDSEKMKEHVKYFQGLNVEIMRRRADLKDLMVRSAKFGQFSSEMNADHVTELRHLWRDVMLKVFSRLGDVQRVRYDVMMKTSELNEEKDCESVVMECKVGAEDLLKRVDVLNEVASNSKEACVYGAFKSILSEFAVLKELLNFLNESTCTHQNSETFKELLQRVACIETRIKTWRNDFVEPGILHNTMNVEAAMDDDEVETISEESKSPRSRAKTWPEHNSILMQIFKELANFEIWLRNAEENVENYIGIAIPQTLNEMKSKLKEIQLTGRSIRNKKTEMEGIMETLAIFKEDDDYSELSKRWQLFSARANDLQLQSDGLNEELKDICFQWQLFESRYFELLQWLHKLRINFITPLKENDEGTVDFVLGKLFKVREIEKKLTEKVSVKSDVLRQGEQLHTRTEAAGVSVMLEQLKEDWDGIEGDLTKERARLENVMKLWKDYDRRQDDMNDWLDDILTSLRALEHNDETIDMVRSQIELIQKHHDQINDHLVLKESLDIAFHYLIDNIHGDVQHLQEKQTDINGLWEDLQTLVSDRFDELVALECDLEKSGVIECVRELNDCVESAKDLTLALIPLVGSSTLDQIKLLVSKYQTTRKELRSKEEKLNDVKRKIRGDQFKDDESATLRKSVAQLDEAWRQVTSSINEKEESLKISLSNWIDFQSQLTHLIDTDSWFATREAVMSKYKHISSEKDRNIALEDVKAMKGFLATQKIVVTSFVDSARSLLTTGLYDSEEIEGILGDIEERWEDIHTKVNDCEVWLGELTTKHKSCQESVGSIMAFLDQAEIVLHNFSSFDVDLEGLNSQKSSLDNLEKEMNEIKLAVDNLTSLMIELNNVCDERFVHELEVDTSELTQRFHRVAMQVKEKKLDVERVVNVCQNFDKDCDELFAWLKYQWETLDAEDEAPQLLANELTKLKEFERLQESLKNQKDIFENLRFRGQELKSEMMNGANFVSPKLEQIEECFKDFSQKLDKQQQSLIHKTKSWLDFCNKLQTVQQQVAEVEKQSYASCSVETMEHYRTLQKLIREVDHTQHELEELDQFTKENFLDEKSEWSTGASADVKELGKRLEALSTELNSKKSETENVQKLLAKFQEQCRHLNAVLLDTEVKLANDMNSFHEDEQPFELFQSNIDQHNAELLCAEELAETLDVSSLVDENTRHEVEGKLSELRERWKTTCSAVEKHKQILDSRLMKWRDFKRKHKEFITWLSEFETRPGLESVVSSDINELETHVEYVEACCSEISSRQSQFERLRSLAEQCLIRSNDKISDAIEREFHEVQTRWLRVSDSIASNQRTLELTLEDWQEYTTVMEDIMKWLRRTELYLKTASASSLSDLEKYYERLKELSNDIEDRRPHLELLTQRGKRLSRMSSYANADHINNQVSVMGSLWTNVCTCLSTKIHCTVDLLHFLRKFMENFESVSAWLRRFENIVHVDSINFYSCSPEEQRVKIKAYRKEIESHEFERSIINDSTLSLFDKEINSELLRYVTERRDALNERWENLCIQLGISYKKAEQTKYSLKLLEAQLTQLNKWMSSVEQQVIEISGKLSCDVDELSQQLVNLQISQTEIKTRSPDVISVLSLCVRLQSCNFPHENDSNDIETARNNFELRWQKITRDVGTLLKQSRDRIALCNEFREDYKQFMTWQRAFRSQVSLPGGSCDDLREVNCEMSRLQDLKRQVGAKGVLLERLLTRGNYLANATKSNSAQPIRKMIGNCQKHWNDISRELDASTDKFRLLSKNFVEFEEMRRHVNAWLTEMEVRLIRLDEEKNSEEEHLQKLKTLQRDINMKYGFLSDLSTQVTKLKSSGSIFDFRLQQQKVEELKLRYEQALHYSLTLILDLAIPSPFSSPNRAALKFSTITS
ncbi:nesprin-1-like isoform X2 [Xenia sp. Carnegie-2017]|nr:nesprin-1-like isoform X2 [Xenia sp. Carnegie-2017]